MKRALVAAFLTLVLGLPSAVESEVVANVSSSYFPVSGNSPAEIYRSMLSQSKSVGGGQTLASISTRARQSGDLRMSGGACVARNYTITLDIQVRTPPLVSDNSLSAAEGRDWQTLLAFIRNHEAQHRQIWQSCASALDRKVVSIREPTCERASAKVSALWKRMIADCDRKQRSFDASQTRALMRLPFVKRATGGGGSASN